MTTPFPPLKNDLLLRAARGEAVERVPVWIMRQAGRYLPEYLEFTADKDFFLTCRTPEFATEVTLQPIRRFDLDASIIFSDILVIPQALGLDVQMVPKSGPSLPKPLREIADVDAMLEGLHKRLDIPMETLKAGGDFETGMKIVQSLTYVCEAITMTRHKLEGKVPLLGFAGSPWTLMSYMVEGGGSRLYNNIKRWVYARPEMCKMVLQLLTNCIAAFLVRQIDAGASAVQVFDSHAAELPPHKYAEFSASYLKQISDLVREHRPDTPQFLFCKGVVCGDLAKGPDGKLGYDVLSIDFHHDLGEVRRELTAQGATCAVQGNMDPGNLTAAHDDIRAEVNRIMGNVARANGTPSGGVPTGYIANLGHGITPDIDPESVRVYIDAVHNFRAE
eukprot:PhM_4_TR12262/c0_g1_i1/m.52958/K01599/hemE, UROD; uroporphyrinogen decarboxylase